MSSSAALRSLPCPLCCAANGWPRWGSAGHRAQCLAALPAQSQWAWGSVCLQGSACTFCSLLELAIAEVGQGAEKGAQCLHYGILPHPSVAFGTEPFIPHFHTSHTARGRDTNPTACSHPWGSGGPWPQWSPRWGCSIPSTHENTSSPSGELCHPSIAAKGKKLRQQI